MTDPMPPLGPPYIESTGQPPPPQFPVGPPEQWAAPPPLLPGPEPPAVASGRWIDDPRHQAIAWGAVAIVFAMIVGAMVGAAAADRPSSAAAPVFSSDTSSDSTFSDSQTESDPTTSTTEPQSLDSVVLDIEKFVERARGLTFKQRVDVRLASDSEFRQLLQTKLDKLQTSMRESQQVLGALGLIPVGFDLIKNEQTLLSIATGGFYSPGSNQVVVRADTITPFIRQVIAHELTHALDDQWFDLGRAQLESTDDEADFGLSGLVEGNARRIEKAYVESLPLSEQLQAMREQSSVLSQHPEVFDLPPVLLTLAQAPYEDGVLFVQDLLDDGGQAELDKAFGAPPITSEQIFDSKRFIAGEGPVAVPAPTADGTAANTGVLGERLLREAFFDSLPSVAEVERAISGWGGDAYVTWTDAAGKTCLRDTFVGDTPADTHELVQAITEWSADHAAIIDAPADGPATFTVCA